MTEAIKMVQALATPKQINRIVDWNDSRNELVLDSNLEINMLTEEATEYYDAKEFVGKVDAVCDILFVGIGTLAKTSKAFHLMPKGLFGSVDFIITDFVGRAEAEGIGQEHFLEFLSTCMDIVIDANYNKGTEKDEDGKVIKPTDFVPPEAAIAKVIEEFKARSISQEQLDPSQVFQGGSK